MKFPLNKEKAMSYVGIGAGYFAGNAIQNTIGQKIANDKLRAVATIIVGAILSKKGKGLIGNVGTGIAVSGTVKLIGSVLPDSIKATIAGQEEIADELIAGPVLNGYSESYGSNYVAGSVLNGTDDDSDTIVS